MRTFLTFGLALLLPQSVCLAGSSVDLIVIAEQTAQGAKLARPTPDHPTYCVAYDAGYFEAGLQNRGAKPPAAAAIERTLRHALGSEGYETATAQTAPSLVLVSHWGCIHPGGQIRLTWEGWLDLVAPGKQLHLSEDFLIEGGTVKGGLTPSDPHDTWELAHAARSFVVVSAYDYADLAQQKVTLLWRVKLSAPDSRGSMDEILPALAGGSGPFLARSFDSRQSIPAQRLARIDGQTAGAPSPTDPAGQSDAGLFRSLMKHVRDFFSGELGETNQRNPASLPPELTQRITAYQQEKTALQGILTDKIRNQAPGPDTRRAIDTFNAENAVRIAALGRMGENIRSELARLRSANSQPTGDQPLDALRREFAIDIRQLENPPAE